ncbi:hypothetical protein CKAH01_01442 [Colletotrichum kahawae]|uniref:Uncharacterized protein n=1 Tax=Colletotrichum kahawae TaxID=34407 RepID=A0AAD9Y5S3_COLKA|nr:hypothetical protein CKAH01_01442 [Colletotrichum kahawae]
MPLRKQPPAGHSSVLLTVPTKCPYCIDSRAARKQDGFRTRFKRLFTRSNPSVCHACGQSGRQMLEFYEVNYTSEGTAANSTEKKPVGPWNETLEEAWEDDASSDLTVDLQGVEAVPSRRPMGSDPKLVSDWFVDQWSVVRKDRFFKRWERWSYRKLCRSTRRHRRARYNLISTPLEDIPEDAEPLLVPRPRMPLD